MGQFFEALKAGARAFIDPPEALQYAVAGRIVKCPHCGETRFTTGSRLLNTRGATFFGFDWANSEAMVLICAECGRIEWFATEPQEVPERERADAGDPEAGP
jgi:predicted nucleic-acid-binding Zn-ribbon protein